MALYKDMPWTQDPHLLDTAIANVVDREMDNPNCVLVLVAVPYHGVQNAIRQDVERRFMQMLRDIGALPSSKEE